jgi:hypothetical protein
MCDRGKNLSQALINILPPHPTRHHTKENDRRIANQRDRDAQLALVAARVGAGRAIRKFV